MKRIKIGELFSGFLLSVPVSISLAFNLFGAFLISKEQKADIPELLLYATVFLLLLNLCFLNRITALITASLSVLSLALLAGAKLIAPGLVSFLSYSNLLRGLFYLIIFFSCLIVYFANKSIWSILLLFAGGAGFFFYMSFRNFSLNPAVYDLFLAGVTALYLRKMFSERFHADKLRVSIQLTGISACVAVMICAAAAISYQVNFESGSLTVKPSGQSGRSSYISLSGFENFDENNRLGAPLKLNKNIILSVKSTADSFYIKASTFTSYNGSRWAKPSRETESRTDDLSYYFWMPAYTSVCDPARFKRSNPVDIGDYLNYFEKSKTSISIRVITITHRTGSVKSLFLPANFLTFKTNGNIAKPSTEDYSLKTAVPAGTSYTVQYPQIDMKSSEIQYVLAHDRTLFDDIIKDWSAKSRENTPVLQIAAGSASEPALKKIATYGQAVEDIRNYDMKTTAQNLELGSTVTERTKDLAVKLTKNCRDDSEKVKAIQKYLQDHYSYTLTPPQPPDHEDFVDYFLFTGKKGYCVHFATAMTVLLRASGVPARYVSGFVSPAKRTNGNFIITNGNAHSWVEVYSHTLGFYPVEATNVAGVGAARSGNSVAAVGTAGSSGPGFRIIGILITLAGIAVFLLLYVLARKFVETVQLRKLKRLDPNAQALQHYETILTILGRFGMKRPSHMTFLEFADRIQGEPSFCRGFRKATDIYMRAAYSGTEISERDLAWMAGFRQSLPKYLRKYAGWPHYLISLIRR